jgi:hypothetical protein
MRFAIPIPRVSILRTLAVLLSITLLGNSIALADEPAANPAQLKKILINLLRTPDFTSSATVFSEPLAQDRARQSIILRPGAHKA